LKPNKLFKTFTVYKNLLRVSKVLFFREFFMAKKPTKAEEDKKKQAYYSKKEKKAKEVKK